MSDGFSLGPIYIFYYSLCLAAAVWAAYFLAQLRAKESGLSTTQITDLTFIIFIAGIVGARLGFVMQNITHFADHVGEIISLSTGGLSIHGGILGGLIALYWYAKKNLHSLVTLTDLFALPLLLGQIVGRLGNYFDQELFGYPTNLPWKMFIDSRNRPSEYIFSPYFHPTFAYEMILNLIGMLILLKLPNQKPGQITAGYVIIFSITRFITEIFRISDRLIAGLSLAQLISLGLLVFGIILWLKSSVHSRKSGLPLSK